LTIDLGLARAVQAQAFGEPGQRTFRLRVLGEDRRCASLWMEKEHLQALSLALTQILEQLAPKQETAAAPADPFPESDDHEFRIGRISIGYDSGDRSVVLGTYAWGADDEMEPVLRVRIRHSHCTGLNEELRSVIAAGRPICPLCDVAIDASGHVCVRTNGHTQQPLPSGDSEDDLP
jgi:uncharacterized repeat protein (TIGR03847 family)